MGWLKGISPQKGSQDLLRFGTTGPSWHLHSSVEHITAEKVVGCLGSVLRVSHWQKLHTIESMGQPLYLQRTKAFFARLHISLVVLVMSSNCHSRRKEQYTGTVEATHIDEQQSASFS